MVDEEAPARERLRLSTEAHLFRVYLISSGGPGPGELVAAVRAALSALPPGSAAVQLREKGLSGRELALLARALVEACREREAPLFINDRADVAMAAGAAGVHLPGSGLPAREARALLGPSALIGASCHSAKDLENARAGGADFAVFGPVWSTPGKGAALGAAALGAVARDSRLPIFALGGIDSTNAAEAIRQGAQGVACVRAVLGAADPRAAAARLWSAIEVAL